jgi:predicted lipoprotein with Yx(FWY)xxD motif
VRNRLIRRGLPFLMLGTVAVGVALAAPSASTVTVKATVNSTLGSKILVNSAGLTLYHYMSEKKGSIACTGSCATAWPPLLVSGSAKPVAGAGLTASKLSTIRRPDGHMQVTYNGLGLYRYAEDKKAGQAKGQGHGGLWYAVTPAGTVTKKAAASASSANSSSPAAGGAPAPPPNAPCPPGVNMDMNNPCYNY